MAATVRALLHDMGVPESRVSNIMIARALPSGTQLRRIELKIGLSCFLILNVCYEIDIDGTSWISWSVDHGKRKGIEHFVKLISWGWFNDAGDRVIKTFCINARICGHSAEESAESIKIVNDMV